MQHRDIPTSSLIFITYQRGRQNGAPTIPKEDFVMIKYIKQRVPFNEVSDIQFFLQSGDVIAVSREKIGFRIYDHYGVYIGNGRIIHFARESGDLFGSDPATVLEADLDHFIDTSKCVYVVRYPGNEKSPMAVVKTAKLLLGTTHYNIIFNNCEHFAVYCKTGIHTSTQTRNAIKGISRATIGINMIKANPSKTIPYMLPFIGIGLVGKALRGNEIVSIDAPETDMPLLTSDDKNHHQSGLPRL